MSETAVLTQGVNLLWLLVVTFLIFFMKAGFAMLEAGQVRTKNVANQLTQNLLTWSVGVLVFFFVGAALSTVVGGLTGGTPVSLSAAVEHVLAPASTAAWVHWLFNAVFAMAAATIVSGAVAGRCRPRMYVIYTVAVAAVVYPVAVGLTWAGGLLSGLGFHDFAGGMVVHGLGGLAGLTAAWMLGPRIDRFNDDGSANVIPGHSVTFAVLGTLILCFGWYGFNVGTAATVFADKNGTLALGAFSEAGRVALVTTLGMAAGALGAGAVAWWETGKLDTLYVANGMLAGLVAITGGADAITWTGGLLLGLLAGAQLPIVFKFVENRLRIDDVCAVFPVHGSAGMLGILLFPVVSVAGFTLHQFLVQVAGIALVGVWTVLTTAAVFGAARRLGQARVAPSAEQDGLDISAHGIETYPEFGRDEPTPGRVRTDGGDAPSGSDE